jgi:V/A-type H+-transporting ATPase subunit B
MGKRTRADHPQVMNASVRLNADATNARTKMENGFDLSDYDQRAMDFARDYASQILAIDVNIDTDEMLDTTWALFRKYFTREEVAIRDEFMQLYWDKG